MAYYMTFYVDEGDDFSYIDTNGVTQTGTSLTGHAWFGLTNDHGDTEIITGFQSDNGFDHDTAEKRAKAAGRSVLANNPSLSYKTVEVTQQQYQNALNAINTYESLATARASNYT